MRGFRTREQIQQIENPLVRATLLKAMDGPRASASSILKAAGMKTKRVVTPKRAKARAWKAFADYIKMRDALLTTGNPTLGKCCTCGRLKTTKGRDGANAGHWLGGRAGKNLFDARACHLQCVYCNKYLHGNNQAYGEFMRRTYGPEVMEELERQANTNYSWTVDELLAVERNYKRLKETLVEGI